MPRVLRWSSGGVQFLMSEVPLYPSSPSTCAPCALNSSPPRIRPEAGPSHTLSVPPHVAASRPFRPYVVLTAPPFTEAYAVGPYTPYTPYTRRHGGPLKVRWWAT
ncbi:hypothetical protein T484DRAFT_3203294 [Baffinella frigidus]|nr:hypothetical protein T484DRAFT_3203294 [Cryptophyta sp. CCMP2293]